MNFFRIPLLEFALGSLARRARKSFFVFIILSLLVFLLSSVRMVSYSLEQTLQDAYASMPDIIIQHYQAGRAVDIDTSRIESLLEIQGVEGATPRLWGYYYFKPAGVNFALMGIDPYEPQLQADLESITHTHAHTLDAQKGMIVGAGVQKTLDAYAFREDFHFILPNGEVKNVPIVGTFDAQTALFSNDVILLPMALLRQIWGIDEDKATDIVLSVPNKDEIATIAQKIATRFPEFRVITQNDLQVSNTNLFNYKSGIFLALFSVALLTFFILIYDKMESVGENEKHEIGVLRAIGWGIEDILTLKLYEAFILGLSAFLFGLMGALIFVYVLDAPLLREIFTGFSGLKPTLDLHFYPDISGMVLLFFATVAVYIFATLIPAWKLSITDADEVLR